jgi:hypothetical protein
VAAEGLNVKWQVYDIRMDEKIMWAVEPLSAMVEPTVWSVHRVAARLAAQAEQQLCVTISLMKSSAQILRPERSQGRRAIWSKGAGLEDSG